LRNGRFQIISARTYIIYISHLTKSFSLIENNFGFINSSTNIIKLLFRLISCIFIYSFKSPLFIKYNFLGVFHYFVYIIRTNCRLIFALFIIFSFRFEKCKTILFFQNSSGLILPWARYFICIIKSFFSFPKCYSFPLTILSLIICLLFFKVASL